MPQFKYVARSAEGKLVDGIVTSNDRAAAIRQVEQQRFVPIKIEALLGDGEPIGGNLAQKWEASRKEAGRASQPASSNQTSSTARIPGEDSGPVAITTMSHAQQHLFTEQLANLLGAGMTLDEALGILVRRMKHPRLHALSRGLHQSLIDGRSLSQALRDYPRVFSTLYINMVAAGEASGALADILRRLTGHLGEMKDLRDRVQQALLYPALLVLAGFGLITIFTTVMVPQLTGFFKDVGGALPTSTQLLLKFNDVLTHEWWFILLGGAALYFAWRAAVREPAGRLAWDIFRWRAPLYSLVIRYRFYAQFARTLGTLVENGVTLLRALELLEDISGNAFVLAKMTDVRRAVVDGATLSTALAEQQLFPELFVDMLAVGEQTGRFAQTMNNIAEVYERELDKQVKIISTLIPPVIMLLVGAVVGFVVYGILSAVFGMTQSLRSGGR